VLRADLQQQLAGRRCQRRGQQHRQRRDAQAPPRVSRSFRRAIVVIIGTLVRFQRTFRFYDAAKPTP